MRTTFLLLGAALLVSGCASSVNCPEDWYARGWSDGRFGALAQGNRYAGRCTGADVAAYDRGWRDGQAAKPTLGGM
jgi:hypothetical protein